MASPHRVMVVFGTRPEAIKLAPVVQALEADDRFRPVVVVTAQHRLMLDQVLDLFAIRPDHDLDVQRDRQTLAHITTRVIEGLEPLLTHHRPDLLVVQGDTTTTFAASLAGFYHQVPVAHVEAGLRTGERYSPYPEEINRRLTTALASLHLAPTATAVANLRAEGIPADALVCTGNTVIDALHSAVARAMPYTGPPLTGLDADPRRVILVTVHRRESWGDRLVGVGRALAKVAGADPGVLMVVPLHLNPVVREAVLPAFSDHDNIWVTDPLPYGQFARLMGRAHLVVTDSGGIQEEAPALGKPVLVLRQTTERPEAVAAGTVEVVGTDEGRVAARIETLLSDRDAYDRMARAVNPYGDGHAARRSVAAMAWWLGHGERPEEFVPAG